VSDEKVKSAVDNAFDDFVKFVKDGLSPTMEKVMFEKYIYKLKKKILLFCENGIPTVVVLYS